MSSCKKCQKAVPASHIKTQTGNVFHAECFKCTECSRVIQGTEQYFEIPPATVRCSTCQAKKVCARCKGIVAVRVFRTVGDKLYHTDCFRCDSCVALCGRGGVVEGDQLWCNSCHSKGFKGVCASCGKSCRGDFTTALDKQWHKNCFVCQGCKTGFPDGAFFPLEGNPYCRPCAEKKSGM